MALRRLDPATAKALRHRFAGRSSLGGIAIVGLFAPPLFDRVVPVIATAFMVHVFKALPRVVPSPVARSAV